MGRKFKNKGVKPPKGVNLPIIRKFAKEGIVDQLNKIAENLRNNFARGAIHLPNEPILSYNTKKTFDALSAEKKLYEATRQEYNSILNIGQIKSNRTRGEEFILKELGSALNSYEQAAAYCGIDQLLSEYNARLQANSSANTTATALSKAPQPAAPSSTTGNAKKEAKTEKIDTNDIVVGLYVDEKTLKKEIKKDKQEVRTLSKNKNKFDEFIRNIEKAMAQASLELINKEYWPEALQHNHSNLIAKLKIFKENKEKHNQIDLHIYRDVKFYFNNFNALLKSEINKTHEEMEKLKDPKELGSFERNIQTKIDNAKKELGDLNKIPHPLRQCIQNLESTLQALIQDTALNRTVNPKRYKDFQFYLHQLEDSKKEWLQKNELQQPFSIQPINEATSQPADSKAITVDNFNLTEKADSNTASTSSDDEKLISTFDELNEDYKIDGNIVIQTLQDSTEKLDSVEINDLIKGIENAIDPTTNTLTIDAQLQADIDSVIKEALLAEPDQSDEGLDDLDAALKQLNIADLPGEIEDGEDAIEKQIQKQPKITAGNKPSVSPADENIPSLEDREIPSNSLPSSLSIQPGASTPPPATNHSAADKQKENEKHWAGAKIRPPIPTAKERGKFLAGRMHNARLTEEQRKANTHFSSSAAIIRTTNSGVPQPKASGLPPSANSAAPAAFVSKDTTDVRSLLAALPSAQPIGPARDLLENPKLYDIAALIQKHEKRKYPQEHFTYERKTCALNGKNINVIHVKKMKGDLSKEDLELINDESLKVRKLSLIAGMINMINHSGFFLAGPDRTIFVNELVKLAEDIDKEEKTKISLDKFIDQLVSVAKSFSSTHSSDEILRQIRNAERYYVAEKNQQTALVFEHKDKDNNTIYQIDIPLGNKLTKTQKQSFIAIHNEDTTKAPMWFQQLPEFEQAWLKNMVPKLLRDDWSAFENLYQSSAMQHIPGIKNGRTNYLAQPDAEGIRVLSSSVKASTLVPYEISKDEQEKQAQQNAEQAFSVLKQKALENKQEKWGNHLKDLPPLILFQALLSNTILSKDDSRLYDSQIEAINKLRPADKSVTVIAGTEAVNILGKASPQTTARWEYAEQVIAYADNLLEKLQGNELTPAQKRLFELITDAKSNLEHLKKPKSLLNIVSNLAFSENLEAFKAAYLAILVEAMGGAVSTNCKSGKDRTGLEEIYCHAMRLYFEQEGKLPQLNDKGEKREKFIAIYKELFDSMKVQEAAAMNTPGSFGINDKAMMLSSDIRKALGESYGSSTERALMNKPNEFKKDEEKQAKEVLTLKEDITYIPHSPAALAVPPKEKPPQPPLAPPNEEPPKPPVAAPVAPAAMPVSSATSVPPPSTPPVPPPETDATSSNSVKKPSGGAPNPVDLRRAFQKLFATADEAHKTAIALKEAMRSWQQVRKELAEFEKPGNGLSR